MRNFTVVRWLSSDDTATVYEAADAGGGPLIYTVGHRPAEPAAAYTDWAGRVLRVRHPHLVPIAAAGLTRDARPFLLTGTGTTTLSERLVSSPPTVDELIRTATAIADALDAVHAAGLRHGTVCPSTVVYGADGTPMLTGFDMCAPCLVKTARPGLYTAPETDPGPAGDVYALAATAYVALGGSLPYTGGGDVIAGVPGDLAGILRTALSFDPAARPTAAGLRDALSTVEVHRTGRTGALPVAVVGSDVRAASPGVAAINQAATGPLPVQPPRAEKPPMPDWFGQFPVLEAGPAAPAPSSHVQAPPAPVSPAPVPVSPVPAPPRYVAPPPAARQPAPRGPEPSRPPDPRKRRRVLVFGAVAAVLLVAALAATAYLGDAMGGWFAEDDTAAPPTGQIRSVDFDTITYATRYDGQNPMTLSGGTYTGKDEYGRTYTWTRQGAPVFADADGDGAEDAAVAMLRSTGAEELLTVVVYRWDGSGPAQVHEVVSGLCSITAMRPGDGGFTIDAATANPYDGCTGPTAAPSVTETFTVGITGGVLAQRSPLPGAAARCHNMDPAKSADLSGPVDARTAPVGTSPAIDRTAATLRARVPGPGMTWTLAEITYTDGSSGCGWIAASTIAGG